MRFALSLLLALGVPMIASPLLAAADAPTSVLARFVVLGDTGEGNAAQHAVAAAVRDACAARGCDFAVIAGDLVYPTGVTSAYDPQFETKFERPYAIVPLRFYLTLGNHDNSAEWDDGTGTDSAKGDLMVDYHYRTDTSGKWFLPARHYAARVGDVELYGLDTNTMMSYGVVRKSVDPIATALAQDPALLAQGAWLDEAMAGSDAKWKIAFGHHPLVSNGRHGNAGEYDGVPTLGLGVKQFVESHVCDEADLYLAGHDHDLQWLLPNEACGATEFLVSGAGAKSRPLEEPDDNPAVFQLGETEGFFWVELRDDAYSAAAFDASGALLFEAARAKPLA